MPQHEPTTDPVGDVRSRLLRNCHLFDDPASYEAGIEDALAAFRELLTNELPRTVTGGREAAAARHPASARRPASGS